MAIVDESGKVLGEAHHSQLETHIRLGGILPPLARDMHIQNIEKVHRETLAAARVDPQEIDAVAVTTMPGLALSLGVGVQHAKRFCKENSLPLYPIHHMEAHALVVRSERAVDFPYLVLLVSGGHCQVAVVRNVTDFALLGSTLDNAPGEAFDKIARRLKLSNLSECRGLSGGACVELLGKRGDPTLIDYHEPMSDRRCCNFSFSGFKSKTQRLADHFETQFGVRGDKLLPNVADMCASAQYWMCLHIMKRVYRAIIYCRSQEIDFGDRLVISGGVACSTYLRMFMKQLCEHEQVELTVPSPHLCSDNGVMIAWNGIERLRAGETPLTPDEAEELSYAPQKPLGVDLSGEVIRQDIKLPRYKIDLGRLLKDTGNVFADEIISHCDDESKNRKSTSSKCTETENNLEGSENAKDIS